MIGSDTFSATHSSDSYTDLANLHSITELGRTDKNQALAKVAEQFESMMVRMMMKSMRDANSVFAEGNFLSSHEGDMYQGMFDDQLALSLSQGKGLGVADTMVRQLQSRFGISEKTAENVTDVSVQSYLDSRNSAEGMVPGAIVAKHAAESTKPVPPTAAAKPLEFDGSIEGFTHNLYEMAARAGDKLGVGPDVLLAQAALETGWGKKLTTEGDKNSFNLFNIKADKRWSGDAVNVTTVEIRDGLAVKERAAFRAYHNPQQSFDDYVDFVTSSPRYDKAVQSNDSESYIRQLSAAGYATDPDYAEKILNITNSENFRAAINNLTGLSHLALKDG